MKFGIWSDYEVNMLIKYKNLGCDFSIIAAMLDRTVGAVRHKYETITRTPKSGVVHVILCGLNKIYVAADKHEQKIEFFQNALWLKTHRPLQILECIHTHNVRACVDQTTLLYMIRYGVPCVRNQIRHSKKIDMSPNERRLWCQRIDSISW
jgi:hypothetical protein